MKKIIISILIIIAVSAICFFGSRNNTANTVDSIFEASAETGWIAEKIIGDADRANVVIYEYADYGCSHCADWNKTINKLIDEYNGKIAVVFRSYDLGFKNGSAAARAATAAQLQGYFKEYKDLLFANQAEWIYEDKSNLDELFAQYFAKASDNAGDLEKFKADIASDAVKKRLDFENELGKKINLRGTPLFRIDGKTIPLADLIKTIEEMVR